MGKFTGGKKRLPAIEFLFYLQRERGWASEGGTLQERELKKGKGGRTGVSIWLVQEIHVDGA